jgi:hypothetical protein
VGQAAHEARVVSRQSRFSKLEGEREGGGEKPASGASLERFASEPELGPRTAPADAMAPEHGSERLQRFEEDGALGLGLDRDPLAALPMLQCPACGIACGKYETQCHGCQASLTTAEARAHNLKRLEALQLERSAEQEAVRQKRHDQQLELEQQRLQDQASVSSGGDAAYAPLRNTWLFRKLGFAACSLALAIFGRGWLSGLGIILFAIMVMTLIPQAVWMRLTQKVRFRDRD